MIELKLNELQEGELPPVSEGSMLIQGGRGKGNRAHIGMEYASYSPRKIHLPRKLFRYESANGILNIPRRFREEGLFAVVDRDIMTDFDGVINGCIVARYNNQNRQLQDGEITRTLVLCLLPKIIPETNCGSLKPYAIGGW